MTNELGLTMQTEAAGGATIVRCGGKLTSTTAGELHARVKPLIVPDGRVVLDLTDVTFMDSMGLGTITGLYVSAKTMACGFELINLSRRIRDLFTIAHLLSLFEPCGESNVPIP